MSKIIHIFFCPPCYCIPVLASSSLDAAIHLWNVDTGAKIRTFDNGPMDAWTDAFSPCATKLISGSHVGKINLFNTETGEKVQSLDTRGKFTLSIAYVSWIEEKRGGLKF